MFYLSRKEAIRKRWRKKTWAQKVQEREKEKSRLSLSFFRYVITNQWCTRQIFLISQIYFSYPGVLKACKIEKKIPKRCWWENFWFGNQEHRAFSNVIQTWRWRGIDSYWLMSCCAWFLEEEDHFIMMIRDAFSMVPFVPTSVIQLPTSPHIKGHDHSPLHF